MSEEQTKIENQRDTIDERNSEIARLHSRMELLDKNDITNAKEHQQLFDKLAELSKTMTNVDCKLEPISDTYKTVGTVAKWFMAILVFLSVLGGVILTWVKVLEKK